MLVCRYIAYGRIRMDTFQYIKLIIVKPTLPADVCDLWLILTIQNDLYESSES